MTKALIVQLADDVVTQLNGKQGGWAVGFQAERKYQAKLNLEQINTLKVLVMMAAWRVSPDNRSTWEHEYDIDIGIFFRGDPKAGEEATQHYDNLLYLAEQITDYWEETRPSAADCPLVAIGFGNADQPYIPESIDQNNSLTTIIKLTFRKLR